MTPQEKLKKIKQELRLANQSAVITKALNEKRESLDRQLDIMIKELEADLIKIHQQASPAESQLMNEFNQKKAILNKLKKHKQELDDKLDEYESFSSDVSIKLEGELISVLLECFPSQKLAYQKLDGALCNNKEIVQEVHELTGNMEQISQHLDKIVQERASVKRRGILSYLFGPNPNVAITQSFKEAGKIAQAALPSLEKLEKRDILGGEERKLYQDIDSTLKIFLEASKKRWGFKSIDSTIRPLSQSIQAQLNALKKFEEHYQFKIEADSQALRKWVEKMSETDQE